MKAVRKLSALLVLTTVSNGAGLQLRGANARGSIEGQVTLEGKPAANVTVTLDRGSIRSTEPIATALSDETGHFKFGGLEPGSYLIDAFAPALVAAGVTTSDLPRARSITLREDETVTGIDLKLTRGGVISGRILDSHRQPLIEITVDLSQIEPTGRVLRRRISSSDQVMYRTDDTGAYRIYGLPAGRYKLAVGVPAGSGVSRYEGGYYVRTFYPGVKDEAEALIVDLAAGSEVGNIDIIVDSFVRSYSILGRVVNSENGRPMTGLLCGYGAVSDSGRYIGSVASIANRTNPTGEFYIEGLPPGRYAAFVVNEGESPLYCEPTVFEITDSDLTGIEVKTRMGASLSGTVGFDDETRIEDASNLVIDLNILPPALEALRKETVQITPDLRFSAVGLRPGKAVITVRGSVGGRKVILSRIERDGVAQAEIELRKRESVSGVRLVLSWQPESR